MARRVPYNYWKALGDLLMTLLTSGIWLLWVLFREIRQHS